MVDSNRRSSTNCDGQVSKGAVDFPKEIISDILSRLPIESIFTCKIVCKTWCDIIRDSYFVNKLCNSHYHPTRLILKPLRGRVTSDSSSHLLLVDIEEQKTRRIPVDKMLLGLRIMCICNGLLCLALGNKIDPVVIYNPITREHVVLPSPGSKPTLCNHKVGLGFDPSSGKYKVVQAYTLYSNNGKMTRFEIISLGESSWRELSAPQGMLDLAVLGVVFWNGALYWKMIDGIDIDIVEFNLSDEKFHAITFPENFSHFQPQAPLQLMDSGGFLTIVERSSGQIKLWRLMRNKIGEDSSVSLQQTYDTHVNWGNAVYYEIIGDSTHNSYLLKVGFRNSQCERCEHLTQFFPQKRQYSHLDIPSLPDRFYTVCFKPSLVSPIAASLRSN